MIGCLLSMHRALLALKKRKRVFLSSDVKMFTMLIQSYRYHCYMKTKGDAKEMKRAEGKLQGAEPGGVL